MPGARCNYGPRNYLGFLYQSLPIGITVEGANILTRNLIIFGQGALRCHPYIHDEIAISNLTDVRQRLLQFDVLFCKHVGYTVSNLARALVYGLSGGKWIRAPKDALLTRYFQQLTRMSTALALISDISFAVLGNQLKRKEAISARLGDVLSQLYMASSVIKYYQDHNKPVEDHDLMVWTLDHCLAEIQQALDETAANFTPRWIGWLVHKIIFPWGRAYQSPSDVVTHRIAEHMMQRSSQRDRITQYCYVGKQADDATGRMELALQALEETDVLSERLKTAIKQGTLSKMSDFAAQLQAAEQAGVLSKEETELLQTFSNLRNDALQVDEFPAEFFSRRKSRKPVVAV